MRPSALIESGVLVLSPPRDRGMTTRRRARARREAVVGA